MTAIYKRFDSGIRFAELIVEMETARLRGDRDSAVAAIEALYALLDREEAATKPKPDNLHTAATIADREPEPVAAWECPAHAGPRKERRLV